MAVMITRTCSTRGEYITLWINPEEPRKFTVGRHEHNVLNLSVGIPHIVGICGHMQSMQKMLPFPATHACVCVMLIYIL